MESGARPDRRRAGRTVQDVKTDASGLYRGKNFKGAAALVTSAATAFSGNDAADLRNVASVYTQLGKAYHIGMAPGTPPTEAYRELVRARTLDRDLGAAYVPEIEQRLAAIAPRAALSFVASKSYDSAFQAVKTADALGSASPTTKSVRQKLEDIAAELVRAAQAEAASDPEAAKKKLHQVLGIIDPKHPTYLKASRLLNSL